jgi:general stress protein 26
MASDASPTDDDTTKARAKLWDLVKDLKFAMFTTKHPNGHLHSRPLTTQNRRDDEDDVLWFLARRSGDVVKDLQFDPGVNIAYADPGKDTYVSVSGQADLHEDPQKVKDLWNKFDQAWFPGGPTDPDVALLRVRIQHASYWDVHQSKLVQLLTMAKAALTGEKVQHLGEHADVHME